MALLRQFVRVLTARPKIMYRPLMPQCPLLTPPKCVQQHQQNFGHDADTETTKLKTKYTLWLVGGSIVITMLNWKRLQYYLCVPKVDADDQSNNNERVLKIEEMKNEEGNEENNKVEEKKNLYSFRVNKIMEYEGRLRQYSTVDKIFRYFASVRLTTPTGSEIFMTPDDFLRSVYPGVRQPDGLGLDQFRRYDPSAIGDSLDLNLDKNSIFYTLGSNGLISFSDYIFLLMVIKITAHLFTIAFRMFDLDGDGNITFDEFEEVSALLRRNLGLNTKTTVLTTKSSHNALSQYFFGKNLDGKLKFEDFLEYQDVLLKEILSLEFNRKASKNRQNIISERAFADLIMAYGDYSPRKKQLILQRIRQRYPKGKSIGITREDFINFFVFLNYLNDVEVALSFYRMTGWPVDRKTLKHVARTVAKVDLTDHIIDVAITIFDDDNDNQLSNREFVHAMRCRTQRGSDKQKEIGIFNLLMSVCKCAQHAYSSTV